MFYRLSRFSRLHNAFRTVAYKLLGILPLRARYAIGRASRKGRLPYKLISSGSTVVQIGAPWDLLHMGRSRSIHFSSLVGDSGRVIVIEPDPENVARLNEHVAREGIRNVDVVPKGAWEKAGTLRFLSDPEHPAANLVAEVFDETRVDRDRFSEITVEVDSLEAILDRHGVDNVRLISLTTNGSEVPIINGLGKYLRRTDYLSVVGNRADFDFLEDLGFEFFAGDDRGYLFARRDDAAVPAANVS